MTIVLPGTYDLIYMMVYCLIRVIFIMQVIARRYQTYKTE